MIVHLQVVGPSLLVKLLAGIKTNVTNTNAAIIDHSKHHQPTFDRLSPRA